MIVVIADKGHISIQGHSGYEEPGKDIICSAVSALVQTLAYSLEELTNDEVRHEECSGSCIIEYGDLSERGQLLIDSFFLGIEIMENSYPDYIRIA